MNTPDITPSYAPMLMLFFTALIIGAGYLAYRKRLIGGGGKLRNLTVIDRVALDRKNGVVLVKAENSMILLGTSAQGITKLAHIDKKHDDDNLQPEIREKIIEFPKIMDTLRA